MFTIYPVKTFCFFQQTHWKKTQNAYCTKFKIGLQSLITNQKTDAVNIAGCVPRTSTEYLDADITEKYMDRVGESGFYEKTSQISNEEKIISASWTTACNFQCVLMCIREHACNAVKTYSNPCRCRLIYDCVDASYDRNDFWMKSLVLSACIQKYCHVQMTFNEMIEKKNYKPKR